ncbi:MAG TPA: hypothetical protein VER17_18000 [Tepidisphaeraceae bacterium]|nr:hypothetical protein [Tepidisphaeraceae bacterium]
MRLCAVASALALMLCYLLGGGGDLPSGHELQPSLPKHVLAAIPGGDDPLSPDALSPGAPRDLIAADPVVSDPRDSSLADPTSAAAACRATSRPCDDR